MRLQLKHSRFNKSVSRCKKSAIVGICGKQNICARILDRSQYAPPIALYYSFNKLFRCGTKFLFAESLDHIRNSALRVQVDIATDFQGILQQVGVFVSNGFKEFSTGSAGPVYSFVDGSSFTKSSVSHCCINGDYSRALVVSATRLTDSVKEIEAKFNSRWSRKAEFIVRLTDSLSEAFAHHP